MLNGCEHPDALASECGATGTPPLTYAGRADLSRDRAHWSFDRDAYRHDVLSLAYRPGTISMLLLVLTAFCAFVMVAVALGAQG
ncbi:hypothetical protein [Sphingobium amiense]|uniref:hypothetical protein n=1 Tax=Sphingobium amiense TaxID=135719 RepID=UPI00082C35CD|nr:hypothetical protein [Sphingobium amiense]